MAADKDLIENIAWKVGDEIYKRLDERIGERIELHQSKCKGPRFVWVICGVIGFLAWAIPMAISVVK